jgi:uncharacterized membrane protein YdjX (TVP38/TMEM64 family)
MIQGEKPWQSAGIGLLPPQEEAGRSDSMMESKNQPRNKHYSLFLSKERLIAGAAWILVIVLYWWYTNAYNLTAVELMKRVIEFLVDNPFGILLYILMYVIRPLFIFPATLVTMAAGYLFGPFLGVVFAMVASNLSSLVAYSIGRFFGSELIDQFCKYDLVNRYATRLRNNSFETSLTLRFLFLPYDLVSYFSGFLKIGWRGFLLATILGSIPGTISFTMIGATLDGEFSIVSTSFNLNLIIISGLMFATSILLSRWFRKREANAFGNHKEKEFLS